MPGLRTLALTVAVRGGAKWETEATSGWSHCLEHLVFKGAGDMGAREIVGDQKIAKVSIVGVGMRSHAGVASRMFEALAKENINIQMISTSEIKVSVVIEEKYLELAVRALHTAFELDAPARQGD